jgi:hypothetical protein
MTSNTPSLKALMRLSQKTHKLTKLTRRFSVRLTWLPTSLDLLAPQQTPIKSRCLTREDQAVSSSSKSHNKISPLESLQASRSNWCSSTSRRQCNSLRWLSTNLPFLIIYQCQSHTAKIEWVQMDLSSRISQATPTRIKLLQLLVNWSTALLLSPNKALNTPLQLAMA